MTLSIVIVAHQSRPHLAGCLRAVYRQADAPSFEIVVVDNASTDGGGGAVRREFPQVAVVTASRNLGFAGGVNLGLRQTKGEHVLLLNPDAELRPGALGTLTAFLEATPDAGLVGPKLINPDGSLQYSCRSFPGRWTAFAHRYALLTRLAPGNVGARRYLLTDWDHASVRAVDWVSGACILARRSVLDQVGGLDEGFFLFAEDVDLCKRVWAAGWKVYYVPDAVAVHHIGISARRDSVRLILARHRSMLRYHHKHFRAWNALGLLTDMAILGRALVQLCLVPLQPPRLRG
jgi:N-acetylglucosaminyl-diphospho-decaprenol L-rhamnosyltransferase